MYTIVVDDKNYMHTSVFEPLMQKSNLVNSLKILVPQYYNGLDMNDFFAILEYKTPESGKVGIIDLNEKIILENGYIQYIVPADIKMTNEFGLLKILMIFTRRNEEGGTSFVRKVGPADIPIKQVGEWEGDDPDGNLDLIDQKLLEMKEMIDDIKEMQENLDNEKADNISYKNNILQLTSHNKSIGDSVKIQGQDLVWKEI